MAASTGIANTIAIIPVINIISIANIETTPAQLSLGVGCQIPRSDKAAALRVGQHEGREVRGEPRTCTGSHRRLLKTFISIVNVVVIDIVIDRFVMANEPQSHEL
jgi:hypothetical protein